jgi:hypothetical protein
VGGTGPGRTSRRDLDQTLDRAPPCAQSPRSRRRLRIPLAFELGGTAGPVAGALADALGVPAVIGNTPNAAFRRAT